MRNRCLLVAALAVVLYLPALQYGFVQDDRAIVDLNPAAHSIPAAIAAFDDPYWPFPSLAGLYRPLTILSFAVDWQISGGAPAWFHLVNALLHALASVLVVLVFARWLSRDAAMVVGLVFAVHPVHVEGVANIVSRTEILTAIWMLAAVLLARRRIWWGAVLSAALAMLSKEHGVITGGVILLDDWLQEKGPPRYPWKFYGVLGVITVIYLIVWLHIGIAGADDKAAPFLGTTALERLAIALPAVLQAGRLFIWPVDLVADYGPQVLPVHTGLSVAALGGGLLVIGVCATIFLAARRRPALSFGAAVAALAYLPTANLLFPSGVILAERDLYLPVILIAAAVGAAAQWVESRQQESVRAPRRVWLWGGTIVLLLFARSFVRIPAWRSNKDFLLTILREHPESSRAHYWAASVLSGLGDVDGARREYAVADSLYHGDPALEGAHAFFLASHGDTTGVAGMIARARRLRPQEPFAFRANMLLLVARRDKPGAVAWADSVMGRFPFETDWYQSQLQRLK